MNKVDLTCLLFPDLYPWERESIQPIVAELSKTHSIRQVEMDEDKRGCLKSTSYSGPFWVLTRNWLEAMHFLDVTDRKLLGDRLAPPAPPIWRMKSAMYRPAPSGSAPGMRPGYGIRTRSSQQSQTGHPFIERQTAVIATASVHGRPKASWTPSSVPTATDGHGERGVGAAILPLPAWAGWHQLPDG